MKLANVVGRGEIAFQNRQGDLLVFIKVYFVFTFFSESILVSIELCCDSIPILLLQRTDLRLCYLSICCLCVSVLGFRQAAVRDRPFCLINLIRHYGILKICLTLLFPLPCLPCHTETPEMNRNPSQA